MSGRQISMNERLLLWPGIRWWGERNRFAAQGGLLWVLSIAMDKAQPLLPVVEAFAEETQGVWRYRLERLLHFMNRGMSLPEALEEVPEVLPEEAVISIRVGWETGKPAEALKQAAVQYARSQQGVGVMANRFFTYLLVVVMMLSGTVGFVMYYIIPKFKAIFDDFGTELPITTKMMIYVADISWMYLYVLLLGILVSKFLLGNFTNWRESRFWASVLSPRFGVPDLLRNLRLAVIAGEALLPVVTVIRIYHPQRRIRRKMTLVKDWMEHGGTCWQGMQREGLLKGNETALLESAERVGNLDWGLHETAEMMERRSEYIAERRMELLRPAFIVVLGLFSGLFAVGMFLPLVKLIQELA